MSWLVHTDWHVPGKYHKNLLVLKITESLTVLPTFISFLSRNLSTGWNVYSAYGFRVDQTFSSSSSSIGWWVLMMMRRSFCCHRFHGNMFVESVSQIGQHLNRARQASLASCLQLHLVTLGYLPIRWFPFEWKTSVILHLISLFYFYFYYLLC